MATSEQLDVDGLLDFGTDTERTPVIIRCFGCSARFSPDEYRGHPCPEPNSGEAYL